MFAYQKFSIKETDHFISFDYPKLEASIQQVVEQLAAEPAAKVGMILSFAKNHSIDSRQVQDYPGLARLISTKSIPLQEMEELFEAGRKNPVFIKELEDHVRSCFALSDREKSFAH